MKKLYDIVMIGHTSADINVDCHGEEVREIGGAVIFSSAAAYAAGKKVAVVTKLNEADKARLERFVIPAEDVYPIYTEKSTSIKNEYFTEDKEKRRCTCISQSEGFVASDIPAGVEGKIYHFAGLIKGDFDGETIKEVSEKGKTAVDVQGLLRCAGETGEMFFADWAGKEKYLPYVYYLKTDAAEAEILTGLTDRYEAARILYSWGAKEIVITHNTEVIAYDGKEMYACPIKARNLSGRSGRGDTTFAAYLAERQDKDLAESLLFATATVSAKMEKSGPYRGTRKDIEAYIAEFYKEGDVRKIQ